MRPFGRLVMALALLASVVPATNLANAQPGRRVTRPPAELLAAFAESYWRVGGSNSPAGHDITHVLAHPEDYPAADMRMFLDGLERLALTGDSSRLRASATVNLSLAGEWRRGRPVPGTMVRLSRIFEQSPDPVVRAVAIGSMISQAERGEALSYLELLAAAAPGDRGYPGGVRSAIGALWAMEGDGVTVLRRLHETGAIREPEERRKLAEMARRGYRAE